MQAADFGHTFRFSHRLAPHVRRSRPRTVLRVRSVKVDLLSEFAMTAGQMAGALLFRHEFTPEEQRVIKTGCRIAVKMTANKDGTHKTEVEVLEPEGLTIHAGEFVCQLAEGADVLIAPGESCDIPVILDDGSKGTLHITGCATLSLVK